MNLSSLARSVGQASLMLALVGSFSLAQAVECSLISHDDATAENTQTHETIALPAALYAACEQVVVRAGRLTACTRDNRDRGLCQTYTAGQRLTAERLSVNGSSQAPWQVLMSWLQGNADRVAAVNRGDDGSGLTPLPIGALALIAAPALRADFDHPALRGAKGIDVHEGGPDGPLVAQLSAATTPSLPSKRLKPGTTYWWMVQTDQPVLPLSGSFRVLPSSERQAALAEVKRVQRIAPKDPDARALMLAGWLQDHECKHEARVLLSTQGIKLN